MASSSSSIRQRRPYPLQERERGREEEREKGKNGLRRGSKQEEEEEKEKIGWGKAFVALAVARHLSASSNLIHDCDEVFNFWEPLHYLLYKSGFQTWEYSSEFALRSYFYLLLHMLIALPASWYYGSGSRKVHVFYALRECLGLVSAVSEATLVVAISSRFGKRLGAYTLMLLCFTSGGYISSTSFLPSTFSMYCLTLASAALIMKKSRHTVAVATVGTLVGWPFSILAFAPSVLYTLLTGAFKQIFLVGFATTLCTMVISLLTDYWFYGRWTSSVVNLIVYNVMGGGDSALYGVEPPSFYLRNGFNNFNIALLLALVLPIILVITRRRDHVLLLVLVSPLYLWLGFMSLQPHKEERFLFPVYTIICLAAAAAIESFPDLAKKIFRTDNSYLITAAKAFRPITLAVILAISYSRTTALLNGYSAPLQIYQYLPSLEGNGSGGVVCIGSEWYRFPSSFFLPSPNYEVRWLNDGFNGLMPFPFNQTAGGTASAPTYFNKQNKASPQQFVTDEGICDFLIELDLTTHEATRGRNGTIWEVVGERLFLDKENSPAIQRAYFIPWAWQGANSFGKYKLLKRVSTKLAAGHAD